MFVTVLPVASNQIFALLEPVGYLMRTTAVYGSALGAADRDLWADRLSFPGSFQPELLAVWLIRSFTIDIVEHICAPNLQKSSEVVA